MAAASDLNAAMIRLTPAFEKETGIRLSILMGSSGNFFAQIDNGAPFDVFLSADKTYPDRLEENGKTAGMVVPYARGQLVIWFSKAMPLALSLPSNGHSLADDASLDLLAGVMVRKIAIANPEHAPYGRAAVAALQHYGIYDRIKEKIVLGESVSQAAQFAQSGNAEVALIPLSLAVSPAMEENGRWLLLPERSYPPIEQAGVVVKASNHPLEGRRFLAFLVSREGQSILHDFGFKEPGLKEPGSKARAK